jgi:hypothetical protein
MTREWHELTRLTRGAPIAIERVRLIDSDIGIDGSFELPPLARLSAEDQYFVMAFVRSHGSIKDMEQVFGISYPTVKNRLNRLAEQLELVETCRALPADETLAQLERGEIAAEEAIRRLSQ